MIFIPLKPKKRGRQRKRPGFASFPQYLAIQVQRFYLAADWTAKKLQHRVPIPEKIDLSALASTGLQKDESLLPQAQKPVPQQVEPDPSLVQQLVVMGFSENGSKRACIATKNASAQVAMNWVIAHMDDKNFNDPLPSTSGGGGESFSAQQLTTLVNMGFAEAMAKKALKKCDGNSDRAAVWLINHPNDVAEDVAEEEPLEDKGQGRKNKDRGTYELMSFITHMGSNSGSGHYVCHIKKR
eukprot:TRINITY_DN765_c0_g1_i1.p1 TRINITY_DN765_c0_g1~~TRINITY_DN765_c0_g1_i1.p1  ORF type:complete len:240 (+),score=44.11 TRINITY_DN765_c0_g1_i1:466-1185(+)